MKRLGLVLFLIAGTGMGFAIVLGTAAVVMDSEDLVMWSLGGLATALTCMIILFLSMVIITIRDDW